MKRAPFGLLVAALLLGVDAAADTLILLDQSRSMTFELADGRSRTEEAEAALRHRFVPGLPDREPSALWTFGGTCWGAPTEGAFSAGGTAVLAALAGLDTPSGGTPLARSLEQSLEALLRRPEPRHLIVITDGEDTCGGDPCQVVRDAQARGAQITVHTVGLGVGRQSGEFQALQCMSDASPGGTATVLEQGSTGRQLADALARISESLVEPTGELLVEVLDAGGRKQGGVGFAAEHVDSGQEVRGTSGSPMDVPPGTYRLHGGEDVRGEVRVAEGERAVFQATSDLGRLHLTASCAGPVSFALLDATGRTLRTETLQGELALDLPPGAYQVRRTRFPQAELLPATVERGRSRAIDLGGLGTLEVAASEAAGQPVELTVEVFDDAGGGRPVATGPTNSTFPLPAGRYNVRVSQEDPRAAQFLTVPNVEVPPCGAARAELRQQATLFVCGREGTVTVWNDQGGGRGKGPAATGPTQRDIPLAPGVYNLVLPGDVYRPNVRIREGQNRVGCR